jgi:hypothetical protein
MLKGDLLGKPETTMLVAAYYAIPDQQVADAS